MSVHSSGISAEERRLPPPTLTLIQSVFGWESSHLAGEVYEASTAPSPSEGPASVESVCTLLAAIFDEWVLDANMQSRDRNGDIRDRTLSAQSVELMKSARQAMADALADPADVVVIKLAAEITGRGAEDILEALVDRLFSLGEDGLPHAPAPDGASAGEGAVGALLEAACSVCSGPLSSASEQKARKCWECSSFQRNSRKRQKVLSKYDYYESEWR